MGEAQFEKVEKGLDCCIPSIQKCQCVDGCPYYDSCWSVDDEYDPMYLELMRDALALILQQQERIKELEAARTARVMTLEEAIEAVSKKGGFVWREQKSHPLCDAHVSPSNYIFDCPSRKFEDYGKRFIPKKNSFRFMWRCWTSWPTDEQREAVPWNE